MAKNVPNVAGIDFGKGECAVHASQDGRDQLRLRVFDLRKSGSTFHFDLLPFSLSFPFPLSLSDAPPFVSFELSHLHSLVFVLLDFFRALPKELFEYLEIHINQLQRNVAVALGNALRARFDPAIVEALASARQAATPLVREHIDWALAQGVEA